MKIQTSNIKKILLTEIRGLDPISVYLENYNKGQGKLIIECYGEAWSQYWGAMGDSDLEDFIIRADVDYIAGKLFNGCLPEKINHNYEYLCRIVETVKEALSNQDL